ncbi:MAG: carbamoyltransferase HypF [Proteobacteria bacterium]|nr:MAG: carbamoyltransferase HypF [Pseudomonadota bacterium]
MACAACGPRLTFHGNTGDGEDPLSSTVDALRAGAIVAIKGVGGYHLVCDATNADALAALRARKQRPGKPLALMAPLAGDDGLDAVRTVASPDREQSALLLTPERPIVLLPARAGALPEAVAPGLSEVGVMLPYSPLHHLLLDSFGGVVVATSGNLSGEPVLTDARQVEQRIGHVADAFLHHDRPIVRPADDSVYRSVGGRPRPMRLGRGAAPLEIDLPFELAAPVVAAGSHMKNTVALGWGRRLVLSPHIGDLDSARSLAVHRQVIADLQSLYRVEARSCVCDAHPDYGSSRWAERSGLEVATVFHHHAHASALAIEFPEPGPWLVFAWDGVGLGDDGTLWGGETLYGGPGAWTRVATFRSFRLPGGERAAREPWRSALALAWELDRAPRARTRDMRVLKLAWETGINAPSTSAVGRIFDAAASLAGLVHTARYEGEAPMRLEQSSGPLPDAPSFPVTERDGMLVADWGELLDDMASADATLAARAARFHSRMASTLLCIAESSRERLGVNRVGLCGGVFQNRLLTDRAIERLEAGGFEVCLPSLLPVNDASIAAGQIVEHAFTASCGVERSP